ncbi:hypothetical protein PX124_22580, partial [Escherichia coli]
GLARLAAVCCAASLCPVAGATRVTPRLVQRVNVAFLVQGDGHAAANACCLCRPQPVNVRRWLSAEDKTRQSQSASP